MVRPITESALAALSAFKPDISEARRRWQAFWQGELIERPLVVVTAPQPVPAKTMEAPATLGSSGRGRYYDSIFGNPAETAAGVVAQAAATYWGGEAVPTYEPAFGPDQFAAFLGAELYYSPDSDSTSWVKPFVEDWERVLPLTVEGHPWYERMMLFLRTLSETAAGRVVIGHLDMHGNMDALAAIRGPEQLCLDLMDQPEVIDRAMASVRSLYPKVYLDVEKASRQDRTGSSCWIPAYCEGRYAVIQCDFITMISPEMFRRWVGPALEEEAAFLDHCIFHLDGPGALKHLPDILAIKDIDVIQWVPGAGQPPLPEWIDLLEKIQKAGKGLHISTSPEHIKWFHSRLKPEKVFYQTRVKTPAEAEELLAWLKRHT